MATWRPPERIKHTPLAAQRVVDQVVSAGISGLMSFAPIQLHVPGNVTLNTVNMAMELERLSFALSSRE